MRDRLPVEDLYLGRIDAAIGVHGEVHGGLFKARLIDEGFLCALRKDHPEAGRRLTLTRYAALEHLLISPFGGMTGTVDAALAEHGLTRVVKLAVPQFAVAPWILLDTDYVLTMPERIAQRFAAHLPLHLAKPPLELPRFSEWMFWHERTHADPAHQWLRQVLREVAAER
jgi:DNA-binding transcriptional LysR family regulator